MIKLNIINYALFNLLNEYYDIHNDESLLENEFFVQMKNI